MSIIKNFLKTSSIYALGNSLNIALAFFLIPIYISNLSIQEYGVYGLLMIIVQAISRFANLGLESAMMRSYYDYSDSNKGKVYTTSLVLLSIIITVIIILGLLFSNQINNLFFSSASIELSFIYYALGIGGLRALRKIPQTILRIEDKPYQYIGLEIFNFIFGFFLIIYLMEILNLGLYGLLLGTFISLAFNVSFLMAFTIRYFKFGFLQKEIIKQIKFGAPLVPSAGSALILVGSGRFFLERFHSLELVGIFTLAAQVGGISETLFGQALKLSWRPFYFKNYKNKTLVSHFEKLTNNVAILSSTSNIAIALFILPFLELFGKTDYLNSSSFIPLFLLYQTFWSIVPIYNGGVAAARKTTFVMVNFAGGALINIILNVLFTPKFGIYGVAMITIITYLIMFISIQLYNAKLGFMYVKWKKHWMIFGIAGIYILMSILIKNSNLELNMLRLLLLLTYPIVVFFIGKILNYNFYKGD